MKDRIQLLKKIVKNKKVLNLGCTSDYPEVEMKHNLWLHKILEEQSKELVGLDIRKNLLKKIKKHTKSTLVFGDATKFDLKQKFDVIVAGEIIEHIEDLSGFFESIKKHMDKNSLLIITTPNAFKLKNILTGLLGMKAVHHPDHVTYFDEATIKELCWRHELKVKYIKYTTERTIQHSLGNKLMRFLGSIIPRYNENLFVVIQKNENKK